MANFSRNMQSQFISVSKHKLLVYLLTQERWKLNFIFIDVYKFLSDSSWTWGPVQQSTKCVIPVVCMKLGNGI